MLHTLAGKPSQSLSDMALLSEKAEFLSIEYFLLSFTDLFGAQRAKLVPAAAIDQMAKSGAGFAGFATWLDMSPADADLFALPDPSTLIQLPWKPQVGWLAANLRMNDKPVEQGPRNILCRLLDEAQDAGFQIKTGVECEFFVVSPDGAVVADNSDVNDKPCYDQMALMRRYDVVTEVCNAMLAMGWKPYQNDHEDANGQFEMNWQYDNALKTADRHVFFKFMVKSIAEKHGLRATFMPKPFAHLTGNGCHVHISLWRDGRNVFADDADELGLSKLAYHFIGGLIYHSDAICAITNPTVNSYKRLNAPRPNSGSTWAPNSVTYTGNNRSHMIRIPAPGRFEFRLADGAANPYLLQAAIVAAGLDGIRNERDPGERCDFNMYTDGHLLEGVKRLPSNLLDALRAMNNSRFVREAFGAEFMTAYTKLRSSEWDAYSRQLTEWERQHTLDC